MARWEHIAGGEVVAPPHRVWALWADASRGPEWNHGIASARLDGPFALDARARVRFKGSPAPMTFRVTELEEPRLFTDEGRLPGATLRHVHRIRSTTPDSCWVEHELSLDGPLAGLWAKVLGHRMRDAAD